MVLSLSDSRIHQEVHMHSLAFRYEPSLWPTRDPERRLLWDLPAALSISLLTSYEGSDW